MPEPTPDGPPVVNLPARSMRIPAPAAAGIVRMSVAELQSELTARRAAAARGEEPAAEHIPEPVAYDADGPIWDPDFILWAWRMGYHRDGVGGLRVVGYTGIARMLGYSREQSARRKVWQARKNPGPRSFPAARFVVPVGSVIVLLFGYDDVREWARQTDKTVAAV